MTGRDAISPAPGVPANFEVAEVVEVDLAQPLPVLAAKTHDRVLVVVRLCAEPVGMLLRPFADVADPQALAAAITRELGGQLAAVGAAHGVSATPLTAAGLPHADCPYLRALTEAAANGPSITVVIATLNGQHRLRRCVESLLASNYHSFEVLVVDNGSATSEPAELCAQLIAEAGASKLRFTVAPGTLSTARNAGLRAAKHDVVAYVDDDERVDRWWLAAVAREFMADERLGFVSGMVLPAELDTPAQARFEQFGGFSKGRGFQRVVFDADYLRAVQSAMYPVPPFGCGGNMSFRRRALEQINGFDEALGAGTPAGGAEDTLALSEVLLAGWRGAYIPDAVIWHPHYRDDVGRQKQLRGYAIGIGAYYTALLWRSPRRLAELARLFPQAIRHARGPSALPQQAGGDGRTLERPSMDVRGLLRGPRMYARTRIGLRR